MVFRSSFPDVDIPDQPVHELIFRGLGGKSDRPALIDGLNGLTVTYGEFATAVNRLAAALAERGIGKGDVVGVFGPNSPAYAIVFHGVLRAGAVATTVNALYTAEEVAVQLTDAGAKLLFTLSSFLDRAESAAKRAGVSDVIVFDRADGHMSLSDLLASTGPVPRIEFDPAEDLAVLPYSSGTTGRAKGVMLTHRALVANIVQMDSMTDTDSVSTVLAVLPFFHIYGMQVVLNHALAHGATVVTMPRFDLTEFLRIIAEYQTDRVYIAPPIAVALAKHPVVDSYDLSALRTLFSGAAPLDEKLAEAVHKRLGCKIRQGYGMTEMSPVSHMIPDSSDDIRIGTVGLIVPNMENKIVDLTTGEEVGVGERGELWCKGPNLMKGYLNNAEATAATLDADGFLHTGDVAVIDENGVVTIVDRLKELIKYKGYQVPPAELEALLLTHPQIADAAVIGVHDDEGEEVPKAFVVLQAGAEDVTSDIVMTFVAERVAPYKKVRVVEFLDAIPKSASGKILRKDLRAREKATK